MADEKDGPWVPLVMLGCALVNDTTLALTLAKYIAWFITPVLGGPAIPVSTVFGALCCLGLIDLSRNAAKAPEMSTAERFDAMVGRNRAYWIFLAAGYLLHVTIS